MINILIAKTRGTDILSLCYVKFRKHAVNQRIRQRSQIYVVKYIITTTTLIEPRISILNTLICKKKKKKYSYVTVFKP